jgi:Uma2 family endonuclease
MAFALKRGEITPAEYLRLEKDANEKSEYIDGQIVAMAGATPRHNRIAGNLYTSFDTRLADEGGCAPFNSDQRVRVVDHGPYLYPDLTIACDPSFDPEECLLNPSVVVEVLSESTERRDRVEKWLHYQHIDTLRAYVLVAQSQILVEVFERISPGADWIYRSVDDPNGSLRLDSLALHIPLTEIYRRVAF